jgi:outer membrane PBP1 activator LpoA protein
MRSLWRRPVGVLLVAVCAAGCGVGTNKGRVCKDAVKAVGAYNATLNRISPDDVTQWKQAAATLATRFDALARESDDRTLSRTLRGMAAEWRGVGTGMTPRDISGMQTAVQRQPAALAKACR